MDLSCFLLILSLLYSGSAETTRHPNKVVSLPGAPLYPEINLFSGYLNGSSNDTAAPIFYVLAEAIRVDPSTAPLLIWFNGGPGASSLGAFFKEHGPYRLAESGSLSYHEFSWNQYANVLYLESPLGVGFSQNNQGDLTLNDLDAAEINFNSLKDFMAKAHPNYADRDYYLTGQSYAGAYVPYFARRILKGIESKEMTNINFKGFAIGDPVFEDVSREISNLLKYLGYGLLPLSKSKMILASILKYEKGKKLNKNELKKISSLHSEIIEKNYHGSSMRNAIACFGGDALLSYMNRDDVQLAFNVGNTKVNWTTINRDIADYLFLRDGDVSPVYNDIFRLTDGSSFRVLIYNGDTDMMISPHHTLFNMDKIAKANSFKHLGTTPWTFFSDFAGVRNNYKNGNVTVDVLTVRGAGHSVPTDLPAQAFQMIHNFIFTEDNHAIDYSKPIRKH